MIQNRKLGIFPQFLEPMADLADMFLMTGNLMLVPRPMPNSVYWTPRLANWKRVANLRQKTKVETANLTVGFF